MPKTSKEYRFTKPMLLGAGGGVSRMGNKMFIVPRDPWLGSITLVLYEDTPYHLADVEEPCVESEGVYHVFLFPPS